MANYTRFIDQTPIGAFGNTKDSVTSASLATTASYALTALSSSYALTASYAISASHEIIKEVSSSYADTASVADGLQGQPSIYVTNITASGNISASGEIIADKLYAADGLYHSDDTDTYLKFPTGDKFKLSAGDVNFIYAHQVDADINKLIINDDNTDTDIIFRGAVGSNNNLLRLDASEMNIGMGTDVPSASLHLVGNLWVSGSNGHITASGDIVLGEDQRIYFEADKGTYIESHASDTFRAVVNNRQMFLLDEDTGNRAVFGNGTKVFIGADNNHLPSNQLEVSGSVSVFGGGTAGGHITASGNISSSATSTASFGTYLGDGSQLTGIEASLWYDGTTYLSSSLPIKVDSHITASGNISSSATITSNILNIGTRVKAIGSSLEFAGDTLDFVDGNSVSYLFRGINAGAFEAYHAGNKKLETTAAGINITGSLTLSGSGHITASGNISASGDITLGHTTNYAGYVAGTTNYMFTNASYQDSGGYRLGFLIATGSTIDGTIMKISGSSAGGFVGIGVPYTTPLTKALTVEGDISASGEIIAATGSIINNLTVGGNLDIADTIYHTGDSNTKIRFPEVDTISFHTSGEDRLRIDPAGHITASGNVSSSATSTASFGTYLGDGSQLSNISTTPFPFTGDAQITGSLLISASATSQSLSVIGSGSTVFDVIGSEGTLFSVDDDLTGTLFTVNDISGLPVLEASASGDVYIGKSPQSLYTTAIISATSASATASVVSLSTSSYDGAFFDYTITSASNARAGSIMSVWNGGNITYTETTTTDIGTSAGIYFQVIISASQAQLVSITDSTAPNTWKVKTIIKAI